MEFSVSNVMHVGSPRNYYLSSGLLSVEVILKVVNEKDLGAIISADLKCSQQCLYAYNKVNKVLGMLRRTIKNKEPR